MEAHDVEIVGLLVSPVHAFAGRPADGPLPDPATPADRVEVRASLGLVGDRYFGHPAHRRAAVTVLDAAAVQDMARELGLPDVDPLRARRNVVLTGFAVDALARGTVFSLDSGDGPVRLRAHRPAHPCRWMDVVFGPGAFRALRGRSGLRCEALDDGVLRLGPAVLRMLEPQGLSGGR
ncbi:MOSC domain-containing protein [Pseudonocardia sp.]|uniref:MOSC domain-containing protein n=1 Tax=Pseudonocardia sp. TaxID=60912 RepID=UPI003D14CBD0